MFFQTMVGLLITRGLVICMVAAVVLSKPRMKQGSTREQHSPSAESIKRNIICCVRKKNNMSPNGTR